MKLLNINKLLSGLLSLGLLVNMTTPVFAYNSTGSNTNLDNLVGEDTAQGYNTEYHDPISSGVSSAQTDVYVTRSSTFTVLVPKTIILSGADGVGNYVVGARGDVLPEDAISIEPDSYELTLYKKGDSQSTVNASITQDSTQVSGDAIEEANGAYALLEGQIEAPNLKAGSWSAKIQFNIRLIEDGEVVEPSEPIEYQDFTITRANRAKIGYTDETTDLVIPETFYDEEDGVWYKVTEIADAPATTGAFFNCTNLKSVVIPDSVTIIGDCAFYNCTGLTSATIGNSVTSIGKQTFAYCTSLTELSVPSSVTTIGTNAFQNVPKVIYAGPVTGSPWGALSVVTG